MNFIFYDINEIDLKKIIGNLFSDITKVMWRKQKNDQSCGKPLDLYLAKTILMSHLYIF